MPRKRPADAGESDPRVQLLNSAQQIVDSVELQDVVFTRIEASREDPGSAVSGEEVVTRKINLLARNMDEEFHARVDLEVVSVDAKFVLNAVAVYQKTTDFDVTSDAVKEFLERVGLFVVWPYMRAKIRSLCDDLGVQRITLPTVRQGEFQLTKQDSGQFDEAEENSNS